MPGEPPDPPHDHPGVEHIIAVYKREFGSEWGTMFHDTVKVNLNYEYQDSEHDGH